MMILSSDSTAKLDNVCLGAIVMDGMDGWNMVCTTNKNPSTVGMPHPIKTPINFTKYTKYAVKM